MIDITEKIRRTYRAPVHGSRIRYRRGDAYADWAHAIVREYLLQKCVCDSDGMCEGHSGIRVPHLDLYGEPDGDTFVIHMGVFDEEVRRGMRRRVKAMLINGWRPKFDV